jgi:hypothetical protein
MTLWLMSCHFRLHAWRRRLTDLTSSPLIGLDPVGPKHWHLPHPHSTPDSIGEPPRTQPTRAFAQCKEAWDGAGSFSDPDEAGATKTRLYRTPQAPFILAIMVKNLCAIGRR